MDHLAQKLDEAVRAWDERDWPRPDVMLVSGSGLATDFGERLAGPVSWNDVLPFTARGIEGHSLELELLEPCPGRVVLYSRGRLHAYQGYTPAQVVFTVRLAGRLGARVLFLTNSSGGVVPELASGSLVVIEDQLNLTGLNPLYGAFPESWGPQFPDMSAAYDPALRKLMHQVGEELGIDLATGVYAGLLGPSYETPAEVRMLQTMGAHVVGMSTVMEVIAARHMGLRCAGLSLVSNPGAGVTDEVLDHADVLAQGQKASGQVTRLFRRLLEHPDLLDG